MDNDRLQGRSGQRRVLALAIMIAAFAGTALANKPDDKFRTMDGNGDGMVSATEHATGARAMFEKMDANGDGNVTTAEMDAGHAKMKDRDDAMHGMKAGEKAKADKAMDHGMKMSSAEKIAEMDSNGDGMLSASEHETGAAAKFREMDANGDGNLSREEMKAGHKAMKHEPAAATQPASDT